MMRKILISCAVVLLFMLTSCSSDSSLNVIVADGTYFQKDKSPFKIKVTEDDQPVEGLDISAEFAMLNMDHGTSEASFTDDGDGLYVTEVELPMDGEWEVVFTINQDGESIEKVINYDMQKAEGVASINGEWITNEDIEFYRFINDLHIAINRENDKAKLTGKELEEALAHWDSQEKLLQDQNQHLTQIIRLRAMALLGEEKGHTASNEEIENAIATVRNQYSQYEVAQKMIGEFGEDKFWQIEKKQYKMIVLSQKVQNDLINAVKKENPDVNEQEIMYLAQKQYEDLLVSQVDSLDIKVM